MYFRVVRIPRILGDLKIVKHVNVIRIRRQNVLQRRLVAQVSSLCVPFRDTIEPFATFLLLACLEHPECRKSSVAFTNGFFLRGNLIVVRETRLDPIMSVTIGTGYSDGVGIDRSPSLTFATRLVADVCDVTCARFATSFTHRPLRHRARYIHDHKIVSFDIIIE